MVTKALALILFFSSVSEACAEKRNNDVESWHLEMRNFDPQVRFEDPPTNFILVLIQAVLDT